MGARFQVAGAGICRARAEGIWRAGAQGTHHRRGRAGTARADLRRVLSHPRLHGDERLVSRRVAVERESAGEFHRRGHLRRAGNGLVLVVYLPEEKLNAKAQSDVYLNMKPITSWLASQK